MYTKVLVVGAAVVVLYGCFKSRLRANKTTISSSQQLSPKDIERFGRHLILPDVGVAGQLKLRHSKVLIVGAGGLASSAGLYLAAAGVGMIGFVDHDVVELTNMHRQIIHTEKFIGHSKVDSAVAACKAVNSSGVYIAHREKFSENNGLALVNQYDIVMDATDNVTARYLVNDACCLATPKRPLVSGAALRWEGQLTVYAAGSGTPCYRCVFPQPPPPETITNCSDGGVLGVIPGIVGALQALEVQKLIIGAGSALTQRMLLFNGLTMSMRIIKLRPRNDSCAVCGDKPTITDLVAFEKYEKAMCSEAAVADPAAELPSSNRITTLEFAKVRRQNSGGYVLIDVRPSLHFDICKLPEAINIPLGKWSSSAAVASQVGDIARNASPDPVVESAYAEEPESPRRLRRPVSIQTAEFADEPESPRGRRAPKATRSFGVDAQAHSPMRNHLSAPGSVEVSNQAGKTVYVMCRRGYASVEATKRLLAVGCNVINVDGGLQKWHDVVDASFPLY